VAQWPREAAMPSSDSLVRQFSVHAIHDHVVFLVGEPAHVVPELQALGFDRIEVVRQFDPAEQLYVLDFARRFRDDVTAAFRERRGFAQVSGYLKWKLGMTGCQGRWWIQDKRK
jgi:hypothetical protein